MTVVGLARKKSVGPPVAVAAILLALAGWFLMPVRYVSTASMVLTVPASGGTLETLPESKPGLTNPLLQFNDALRTTAGILILATNTPEVAASLGVTEDGPTSLTINDGRTNPDLLGISTNGPFVYIEVESTSPALVREVMAKAQQRVKLELAERQVALDAPISTHIGVLDVMPASVPKPLVQDRLLAAAGGAFAGVVGGLALAYALIHRRIRARLRRAPAPEITPAAETASLPETAAPETTPAPETAPALETVPASEAAPAVEAAPDAPRRNGAHHELTALPAFPLTVEELESGTDPRPVSAEIGNVGDTQQFRVAGDGTGAREGDDTGPIPVTRETQPDSTT